MISIEIFTKTSGNGMMLTFWGSYMYLFEVHNIMCAYYTDSRKSGNEPTEQKMKFSITDFFCKCDQIRKKLRIWSHLLKKSVTETLYFVCSDQE